MKPHEFRELVNDIQRKGFISLHQYPANTIGLWEWLLDRPELKNIPEDKIHHIFCTCKAFAHAGQFRERLVRALIDAGIERDWIKHEGMEIDELK